MKIYLCREHVQVGEELIHMATTHLNKAKEWRDRMHLVTGTVNFDIVECQEGELREDI